ncbi:MAG: cytochrome c oxidase subunit 3 family protein [Candidatus Sumerlaeaceae bacterium]
MSTHASAPHEHGHSPGQGHNPYLAHHFEDFEQQEEAHALGLWIFLATEIMFFGGLFLAFTAYHIMFPDAFAQASLKLDERWGIINTVVLLFSSFTMAMGVWSAQTNRRSLLIGFLSVTLLCGFAFMGIKTIEYKDKYTHHLVPGPNFNFTLKDPHHTGPALTAEQHAKQEAYIAEILKRDPFVERHAQMYFVMYFCLTGLHGFHVLCGIGVISWMLLRSIRGEFNSVWNTPVHLTGLYWHLVDLVWIYLFPLIYLVAKHHLIH